jgi:hypothetical protein
MLPPAMDLLDDLLERFQLHSPHLFLLGRSALDTALAHFFSLSCSLLPLVRLLADGLTFV